MSEKPDPFEVLLGDSLRDVTRKERRNLLTASTIGLLVAKAGVIPSKISALGVELDAKEQRTLVIALAFAILYFLAAFWIYAATDFLVWRIRQRESLRTEPERPMRLPDKLAAERAEAERRETLGPLVLFGTNLLPPYMERAAKPAAGIRIFFDYGFPLLLGVYAASSLFFR